MKFIDWLSNLDEYELDVTVNEAYNMVKYGKVTNIRRHFVDEYKCTVEGRDYYTRIMVYDNGVYEIYFFMKDKDREVTSLTNLGGGTKVLGGVMDAIRQFINEYKPNVFQFEAFGSNRIRVYDNIIRRYGPQNYDLQYIDNEDIRTYRFIKK